MGVISMASRKPNGYWQNQDNFERGVREAVELNDGNRPTQTWLRENGYSSLIMAAQKHYDGFRNVLDRIMGEEGVNKPKGYWQNQDNFEREAKEAIELNDGNRPTQRWLNKNGYGSLVDATAKYYGGFTNVFDRIMGEETEKSKPHGYWKDWDNFERGVKEAIELNDGNRPTAKWLQKNGYSILANAANRHYDGLANVFNRIMGEEGGNKPNGYWQNQDNFERELKEAIEKNEGNRPTSTWLRENGYSSLVDAAQNHYGGFTNVFDRVMGEEGGKKPNRYWQNQDNLEREAKEAIELNDGNRPTAKWLHKNGYGSLVTAARTYHDGLRNVLDRVMGAEPDKLELFLKGYVDGGNGK